MENNQNNPDKDQNDNSQNNNHHHDGKKKQHKGQQNRNDQEKKTEEINHNFKDGQILKFVRVRFPGNARSFPFLVGKRKLSYGQKVVAMSDRGMAVGYINSFPYELEFKEDLLPIRSISKVASDKDIEHQKNTYKKEKEYETLCKNLIDKHNLDMNLTHVEFTQFGKKAVFYFTAPARVDFRGLVKDLVSSMKLRIELRQISVRDRAAAVGGIGPCGRQLCCSSFLSKYGNVSIKLAKNQNLTLTYSKLNGVCGQLKCCLQYEDTVYEEKRSHLPKVGHLIYTYSGIKGRVERLHLLQEQFDLLTPEGTLKRFSVNEFKGRAPSDFHFPKKIEHIVNETNTVIGQEDYDHDKAEQFRQDMEDLKQSTIDSVNYIFDEINNSELESIKNNKVLH